MQRMTFVVFSTVLVCTACGEVRSEATTTDPAEISDREHAPSFPPSAADPRLLLADLVEIEHVAVFESGASVHISAPASRAVNVDARTVGEPFPEGFFELNAHVGTTPPTASVILIKITVSRSAAELVFVEQIEASEQSSLVVSCEEALAASEYCWASVFAWIPEQAPLSFAAESVEDGWIAGLQAPLSIAVPLVQHLDVDHDGDATFRIESVAGHVRFCVRGEQDVLIADSTEPLPCL